MSTRACVLASPNKILSVLIVDERIENSVSTSRRMKEKVKGNKMK